LCGLDVTVALYARRTPVISTVLIVDDEIELVTVSAEILRGAGFRVIATTDGSRALETLRRIKVDVLVTDLRMPRPDCWDLLDELQRTDSVTETVLVTGCATRLLHDEARARGVAVIVEKPFAGSQLVAAVTEAAQRRTLVGDADVARR
jgi:DNA-binding NtrC family response regulator